MASGFFRGLSYPLRGARFVYVEHRGLARYWIVPVLLTTAALAGAVYAAIAFGPQWADALWTRPQQTGFWGELLGGVHAAYKFLLTVLLAGLGMLISVACSNLLAAPFNDALSREVERIVCGKPRVGEPGVSLLLDLIRTIALELLKLVVYVAIMLPLVVAGWLAPGVGQLVTSPIALLLSVTFFALDYVDWPAARRDWSVGRRIGLLGRYPRLMLGFGLGVWVLLFVPLLNLLFMPAAVAGGTLLFLSLSPETSESSKSA